MHAEVTNFQYSCSTCVNDDMLGEIPNVDKSLVAHVALVWSDVIMMADVIGQLTGLDKPTFLRDQNKLLTPQNVHVL